MKDSNMTNQKIRPIPLKYGVGFCSYERIPEFANKYHEEKVGNYWNYTVTDKCNAWPFRLSHNQPCIIDGFSPNLNKSLHVGHLRQLILAKSLSKILEQSSFVSLLGASQGVHKYAQEELEEWFDFVDYHPTLYYDVLMPVDIVKTEDSTDEKYIGCKIFNGPKGPVIVTRSDGRHTYAHHDLVFAQIVKPTRYITGAEQKEHFESIGLGDKHLPMGLVLGNDGKKIKSRTGDAATAKEILQEVMDRLDETPDRKKLAWNILVWNLLHVSRGQNVKFNPDEWIKPDAPGLYITYTLARINSALHGIEPKSSNYDTQDDVNFVGFARQYVYWEQQAIDTFDPCGLANFTHDLARKIGTAYHEERIKDGRPAFQNAIIYSFEILSYCMKRLGMFCLDKV